MKPSDYEISMLLTTRGEATAYNFGTGGGGTGKRFRLRCNSANQYPVDCASELTRIVTAVNAHDDLVAALERIHARASISSHPHCRDISEIAIAALAKAKGEATNE